MRLGIHTHALSSLTIKSTSHTNTFFRDLQPGLHPDFSRVERYSLRALYTCVYNARQYSVVKDLDCLGNQLVLPTYCRVCVVGPDGIEPSTSPLSGVRSSQLSYGPNVVNHWWSWSGSNRRPPECKSGALPAELQPLRKSIEASWMQGQRETSPLPLSKPFQNSKWR